MQTGVGREKGRDIMGASLGGPCRKIRPTLAENISPCKRSFMTLPVRYSLGATRNVRGATASDRLVLAVDVENHAHHKIRSKCVGLAWLGDAAGSGDQIGRRGLDLAV